MNRERDAFPKAAEMAAAARIDAAPSADLLERLRAIPEVEERRRWSIGPLAALPLPEGLRERLRKIPLEDTPPAWIRRPSYAVAASYLLTVLVGAAFGNPATFAREKAVPLTTGFTEELTAGLEKQARTTLTGAGTEARLQLDQLSASAGKTYRDSKALLVSSLDTTHRKIKELAGTILPAGEPEERDANGDPPPSKGDTDE